MSTSNLRACSLLAIEVNVVLHAKAAIKSGQAPWATFLMMMMMDLHCGQRSMP